MNITHMLHALKSWNTRGRIFCEIRHKKARVIVDGTATEHLLSVHSQSVQQVQNHINRYVV
jgi:hypothetical protein